ncbi:MAG: fumarylacetoacetate hydrolase family protein [Anaerolineae bacterium]|nr:fumarylacetoacetate hydrolase family protein [Anaerolineae bacterium]
MRLITYQTNQQTYLGALLGEQVLDLPAVQQASTGERAFPTDMIALLNEGEAGLARVASLIDWAESRPNDFRLPLGEVKLLPPVLRPGKVVALGRNYAAHAKEGGAEPPDYPMLFHKTAGSLLGAGGTIIIPPVTEQVDYEGELAIIIGRACKQVSPAQALDYVAGYTIANDVSARDLQRRTSQFSAGKMLDTFGPLGPALVTRDEVPDPGNLSIRTILNGQVMQDDTTANMIFDVPFTISYISQIATLEVGDVILTGTPEGVGFARKPPVYMQDGDVISVEIERLGVLTNGVKRQS